jgi:hypothetical protein
MPQNSKYNRFHCFVKCSSMYSVHIMKWEGVVSVSQQALLS